MSKYKLKRLIKPPVDVIQTLSKIKEELNSSFTRTSLLNNISRVKRVICNSTSFSPIERLELGYTLSSMYNSLYFRSYVSKEMLFLYLRRLKRFIFSVEGMCTQV